MKFDDFLKIIGEFGWYQRRTYCLQLLPVLLTGMQIMAPVFILDVPSHRCKIPGLNNDTYFVQDEHHQELIDKYIPTDEDGTWSKCYVYFNENSTVLDIVNGTAQEKKSCNSWVYDWSIFTSTAAAEINSVCDRKIYKAHASTALNIGSLVGFLSAGALSDRFGRKRAYMLELIILAVFSTIIIWLPNVFAFIIFRFIIGIGFGGFYNGAFVYTMEFVGPTKRTVLGILINNFWGVGLFIHTLMAWLLRDWRHLQLATAVPHFIFLIYFCVLPESPRWLLAKGHTKRGMKIIRKMAETNKADISASALQIEVEDESGSQGNVLDLFKHRKLCITTLIVFLNWAIVSMQYYGLSLNVGNLSGSLYLNYFLTALTEVCAYTLCIPGLYCTGRKTFHCACMIVGGVALLTVVFPTIWKGPATDTIVLVLSMIGKFGSSAAFATIYLFSVELFPTVVRNSAMGASAAFSGVGAIIAPYVVELGEIIGGTMAEILPILVFGITSVVAGLLALLLPETRNRYMPENIHDMKELAAVPSKNTTEKSHALMDL